MSEFTNFPRQLLSMKAKNKSWRKRCVDWADSKTFFNYSPVRKSVIHKKINYDLINGKVHMEDIQALFNPNDTKTSYSPDKVQHYPIMNSKLNILRGEELKRVFNFKVIVTNPNAISEIEEAKHKEIVASLQQLIEQDSLSEDEYNAKLEEINKYYTYKYQDFREINANCVLNHYIKEYNMPLMFNNGFMDGLTVGEEIYMCDIVGGEPVIERVNPLKIRVFKSGYSNKIEDADIIIIEDYWSPGRVIDTFYDSLSKKDMEYIENLPNNVGQTTYDSMDNIDERYGFVNNNMVSDSVSSDGFYSDIYNLFGNQVVNSLLPYDLAGNLRVLRIFWKSKRAIKKVKSYDPDTGEEVFNFYPEDYICNKDLGEEEERFWINQAWEGTKIGSDIYINMRPRVVQYNTLDNPSRCHFGIVGSIYNLNEAKPFSLVDMMKSYNYLYDLIHDRLVKLIARNYGKILELDLAKVPDGWTIDKWLYFAKTQGIAVSDSFKESNQGASTGKLAGYMNNASRGVIDADWGNNIQQYINLLEFIKLEMSEVVGITKQREGQISNRETVGGVERATLQSSHITEWAFAIHDDVKKRALTCFLETAKIAMKGRTKKFEYILPDYSSRIIEIDGNNFAESSYGLVVDNSEEVQKLQNQYETLAQAALQNQTLKFSTIMKLYSSASLAEKQRLIEEDENETRISQQQALQQEQELKQQEIQSKNELEVAKLEQEDRLNERDNEVKLLIANINAQSKVDGENDGIQEPSILEKQKLEESIRQFNAKLKLDKEKLDLEKKKAEDDHNYKMKSLSKKPAKTS